MRCHLLAFLWLVWNILKQLIDASVADPFIRGHIPGSIFICIQVNSSFTKIKTTTSVPAYNPATTVSVGFTSTARRFNGSTQTQKDTAGTGPGSYESASMARDVEKQLVSRTGVFGTTTKRFHQLRPDMVPGVGSYEGAEHVMPSSNPIAHKATSVFASRSRRSIDQPLNDVPPPGTYTLGSKWQTGSGQGLLNSGGERFEKTRNSEQTPGPGRYDSTSSIRQHGNNRRNVMLTTSKRFEEKVPNQTNPGPGSYDAEFLYGNLNKPTFNMSIADGSA